VAIQVPEFLADLPKFLIFCDVRQLEFAAQANVLEHQLLNVFKGFQENGP
jgi:hypothetical protein